MIDLTGTSFMIVLLIVLVLLILLWFWQKSPAANVMGQTKADRDLENVRAYKFQLMELERELNQGNIDKAGYDKLLAEMQEQLLEDVEEEGPLASDSGKSAPSLLVFNGLLAFVLISTLLIYLPQGLSLGAMEEAPIADLIEALGEAESREDWTQRAVALDSRLKDSIEPDASDERTLRMLSLHAQLLKGLTRYEQAADTYQQLAAHYPEEAFYPSSALEATYFSRSFKQQKPLFTSEMDAEMLRLLADFPEEPMLLSLSGTSAFEKADYQLAATRWQAALELLPGGSPQRAELEQGLQLARARLAGAATGGQQGLTGQPTEAEIPDEPFVHLKIDIDRSLLDGDSPTTPVFVFARAADGSPLPLAAKRLQLRHLPAELYLTASDAMAGVSIADVERVRVAARLSRGGDPRPQSGDIESLPIELEVQLGVSSESEDSAPSASALLIDQLVP